MAFERVSKSISNMLKITSSDSLIVNHIRDNTPEKAVVFITGIGKVLSDIAFTYGTE